MARSEELRFRAGAVDLAGTLTLPDPEAGARHPWVVMLPSWLPRDGDGDWDRAGHPAWFEPGGEERPLARLADALAAHGVASLRYDKRGCGASGGDWASTDLFTLIDDARDAIGAMRSRLELDLRRSGLVGHGEGAAIGMAVAIGDPAMGALTLLAPPARPLRDLLRRGAAERERSGADRRHPLVAALDRAAEELIERADRREPVVSLTVGSASVQLGLAAWEQAFHTPALALATMLHRSVELVAAGEDAWAPPDEAALLADVLRGAGNEPILTVLPGAGHGLAEADDEALSQIAARLAERLVPRELPPVLVAIEQMRGDPPPTG